MNISELPTDVLDIINKQIKDDYIKQRILETPLRHALKKKLREDKEVEKWRLIKIQDELNYKNYQIQRDKNRVINEKKNKEHKKYCNELEKRIETIYPNNILQLIYCIGGDSPYIETHLSVNGNEVIIDIY